jgi:hypothetical protein
MPQFVNGEHQVKRGEHCNGNTENPNPFPLVQEPRTNVGKEPLAQYRRTIEKPTSRNNDDHAKPD